MGGERGSGIPFLPGGTTCFFCENFNFLSLIHRTVNLISCIHVSFTCIKIMLFFSFVFTLFCMQEENIRFLNIFTSGFWRIYTFSNDCLKNKCRKCVLHKFCEISVSSKLLQLYNLFNLIKLQIHLRLDINCSD